MYLLNEKKTSQKFKKTNGKFYINYGYKFNSGYSEKRNAYNRIKNKIYSSKLFYQFNRPFHEFG